MYRFCGNWNFETFKRHWKLLYQKMTYMPVVVHQVVGEFKFVKRHDLFHPLLSSTGWVRVNVYSPGYTGVCLASYQPLGAVERVPITLVIHGNKVHHKDVLRRGVQPLNAHLERRKHAPEGRQDWRPSISVIHCLSRQKRQLEYNWRQDMYFLQQNGFMDIYITQLSNFYSKRREDNGTERETLNLSFGICEFRLRFKYSL